MVTIMDMAFSGSVLELHTRRLVAELLFCRRPIVNVAIRISFPPMVDCNVAGKEMTSYGLDSGPFITAI